MPDPIYAASAVYTEDDFIGFMKVYNRKDKQLRRMEAIAKWSVKGAGVVMVLSAVVNLMGVVYARVMLGETVMDAKLLAIQAAMLCAGAVLLFLPVDKFSGKRAWRMYTGQGMNVGYRFYDNCYVETRQGNDKTFSYRDMALLFEDPARYFLFTSPNEAHIIVKSGFSQGDPETFGAFIAEKTGLDLTSYNA
ncbi:MAG: YcxB family protein [Ruminococcaceae bacterium]|jgi:hypothetical protein|nr:YcxB family protein [Oscillospiraceae bacterium]